MKWSIYDYGTKGLCLVRWPGKLKPAVTDAVAMYCDVSATLIDIAGGDAPKIDGKVFLLSAKRRDLRAPRSRFFGSSGWRFYQRAIRGKEFKLI